MAQVISRRSIIYDILFDVEKGKRSAKDAEKALDNIGNKSSGLNNSLKTLGKTIAASFAVERVLSFLKTASELADKAGAIRVAFDKLNGVSLAKLREATGGAVNDIVLMQKAVQASHFKVPLQELEKLFRFATIRAKETGESVDGLVDAIIEGLGGGSARAFKALGISSTEFQNKIKQTGNTTKAVTEIIDASFKRTGNSLEGLVDASDKLDTSITNFQITIGNLINEGFLDDFKDWLGDAIQLTTDLISGQRNYNEELAKTGAAIKKFTEEDTKRMITTANVMIEVQKQQADQGRQLSETEIEAIRARFEAQAQAMIDSTKVVEEETGKQSKALKDVLDFKPGDENDFMRPLQDGTIKSIGLVGDLQAKLSRLNEAIPTAQTKEDLDFIRLQIALVNQELDKLLSPTLPEAATANVDAGDAENDALMLNNELTQANIDLKNQQINATQQLFDVGASLLEQNSSLGKAFFILSKGIAAAEVIIKLQQTIAGLQAGASPFLANPITAGPATALLTAQIAKARISAALGIGTILATTIPALELSEGEVDIHRLGEKRGKDSIPAVIMPGETVTTTEKTRKYKPFLEAIHDGSLEDLIRVNYVEPALALRALEGSDSDKALLDYSERFYRQLLETKDTNLILKKIEHKIGRDTERALLLRLKRKF